MTRALLILALVLSGVVAAFADVRIKDITSVRGEGQEQLLGYGLVVGLQGTGDTLQNVPFTQQAIQSMLDRFGLDVRGTSLRNRNVAAVMVSADMPLGSDPGSRLDITVSAVGDSPSLLGGTLLLTEMAGADGQIYATAQGAVSVTGFDAAGQGETLTQGVPTAGRISNGAIVQRESAPSGDRTRLVLQLKNPDYQTAVRIVDSINAYSQARFNGRVATPVDDRLVALIRPRAISFARFLAEIGELTVQPDNAARVVIDARTGTIVIGQDVQISTVAVTHGTLTVRVTETPNVSQPAPLSRGQTVVTPSTKIEAAQQDGQVRVVAGSTLRGLVNGLNQIGLRPTGIIAILQAIKTAGALQAELVVQ